MTRSSFCLFWCENRSKLAMRILIADDDNGFVEWLTLTLESAGHEVVETVSSGGLEVMRAYSRCLPDVVLMDFIMPHYNGVAATRQILSMEPSARVVVMSGLPDTNKLKLAAANAGALAVLQKPFSETELVDLLAAIPFASRPSHKDFRPVLADSTSPTGINDAAFVGQRAC